MRNYKWETLALIQKHKVFCFFGVGSHFNGVMDYWLEFMPKAPHICSDNDPDKWDNQYRGVFCHPPKTLAGMRNDIVVFITTRAYKPIQKQLNEMGVENYVLPWIDIQNADYIKNIDTAEMVTQLCSAYALLGDDKSREVFCTVVERVLGKNTNVTIMGGVCEPNQYFPKDLYTLRDDESCVDCGAFDGDTFVDFTKRTGGKFYAFHAFELNQNNYEAFRINQLDKWLGTPVALHMAGVSDKDENITYADSSSPATKVGEGTLRGRLVTLDRILENRPVTIIKMDIEGYELKALQGATKIIQEQAPILAICVYHRFRDLWEIPLWIKQTNPDYKIYLRHHTNLDCETVCYAIPPNRSV